MLQTPLHLSAEHGHEQNIKILLDSGASYTAKDINGLTALDLADRAGHENCLQILKEAAGKQTLFFLYRLNSFNKLKWILYRYS